MKKIIYFSLVAGLLTVLFTVHFKGRMRDFEVYWTSGQRFTTGEIMYRETDGHYQHKYPPFFTFALLPVFLPSLPVSKGIWFFCSVIMLFFIFRFYNILIQAGKPEPLRKKYPAILLTAVILFRFYAKELELGQVNILIAFMLALSIKMYFSKRDLLSGLFFALSVLVKPPSLIFLPYFLLRKKFRSLISAAGVFALAFFLPAVRLGFNNNLMQHREWLRTLGLSTPANLHSIDNQSFTGLFFKLLEGSIPAISLELFILIALILCAAAMLYIIMKGKNLPTAVSGRPELLEFGLLFNLMVLFSPLGWDYGFQHLTLFLLLFFSIPLPVFSKDRILAASAAVIILLFFFTNYEFLRRDLYFFLMGRAVLAFGGLAVLLTALYLRKKGYA